MSYHGFCVSLRCLHKGMETAGLQKKFCRILHRWYAESARELPWRQTRDPYRIWLSEVILQQTQVAQGYSYYEAFVNKYPTVADLAAASLDEVLKLWQGLGYYSRARNLHAAAKMVVEEFGGSFPTTAAELQKLKGVGRYTAAAIASFAFDEAVAVVDGNVYRFLARYFGIDTPIDTTLGERQFRELAQSLLPVDAAALHNQAMMEFGALQCVPHADCSLCPFSESCRAYALDNVSLFPVKQHKVKIRTRYLHYIYIMSDDGVMLHQRQDAKDIWCGLYELPLVEHDRPLDFSGLTTTSQYVSLLGDSAVELVSESGEKTHQLTHQKLIARCFYLRLLEPLHGGPEAGSFVPIDELDRYAVPKLVETLLEKGAEVFGE